MGRGMRNDVFVGNIAFGTTDEDIRRIFSEVGRVLGVRMAVNAETGKPRGYCFVEYDDAATALSAIRNLNNRDVGGRQLRVNFSNNSALVDYAASRREGGGEPKRAKATPRQLVEGLSAREVWDAVSEAKALATEGDGERLAALLGSSGALTDALVHALLQLGMIRAPPDAGGFAPPPPPGAYGGGGFAPPRAPPPPPLEAAAAAPSVDLVNAAMKLTPAQLAQLPPDRRAKIELLRAKIRQGQLAGAGGPPPPPPGSELL
jgi:cleavage stimulation factor subunit 2